MEKPPDARKTLDYVTLGTTSGLKSEKSNDRKLALRAMQSFNQEMFTYYTDRGKKFIADFTDMEILEEIKRRFEYGEGQ